MSNTNSKFSTAFFVTLIFMLFIRYVNAQEKNIFENKFLLVLDMQEDYIVGKMADSVAIIFVDNVNKVISKVESSRVVYMKTAMIATSLSFKGVSVDTLADLEFCKNLKIVNNNIFIKEGGNAFDNNGLATFLKDRNASEIIIIGLLAEKCISRTAIGGLESGYNIYLVPNAILGKKEKTRQKTLNKLKNKGAKIITE